MVSRKEKERIIGRTLEEDYWKTLSIRDRKHLRGAFEARHNKMMEEYPAYKDWYSKRRRR